MPLKGKWSLRVVRNKSESGVNPTSSGRGSVSLEEKRGDYGEVPQIVLSAGAGLNG